MWLIDCEAFVKEAEHRLQYNECTKEYAQGVRDTLEVAKFFVFERPQSECDCSDCDYFKFSQSFIENVVKFMTDYNIETVEGLMKELNHINKLLGGRE